VYICLNEQHAVNILGFGARAPCIRNIGIKWLSVGIEYRSLNPNSINKLSDIIIHFEIEKYDFFEGL
jgi:hypothetical protein